MQLIENISVLVGTPNIALYTAISKELRGYITIYAEDMSSVIKTAVNANPALVLIDEKINQNVGACLLSNLLYDIDALKKVPIVPFSTKRGYVTANTIAGKMVFPFKKLDEHVDTLLGNVRRLIEDSEEVEHFTASLVMALQAKDGYSRNHSARVAAYTALIARELGEDADEAYTAGLLHDIGKIGIPDLILSKPGKLTDSEFGIIKTHPIKSENICTPVKSFHKLLPIIRAHHERFDGKGYPDGLKGNAIPKVSRMIAIADSFDALTSDRPYRKHFDLAKTWEILEDGKGTQWDPEIITYWQDSFDPTKVVECLRRSANSIVGDLRKNTLFENVA